MRQDSTMLFGFALGVVLFVLLFVTLLIVMCGVSYSKHKPQAQARLHAIYAHVDGRSVGLNG